MQELELRANELLRRETEALANRGRSSRSLCAQAQEVLAGGRTSAWQVADPYVTWIVDGAGATVRDVDGERYLDLHGGFGTTIAGHAHPVLSQALAARVAAGIQFSQPVPDAIAVAASLRARFGLVRWCFATTGTEATMTATQLMRATTARPLVIKVEGHYHGHHDALHHAVAPSREQLAEPPVAVPDNPGLLRGAGRELAIVPYNDLDAVRRVLTRHPGEVAGMILEPLPMNPLPVEPAEGYLPGLRDLLHDAGALLTFDEVQTGLTVHPSGATGLYGVAPDLICLSKALGAGIPIAAIGGTEAVMGAIHEPFRHAGTFNANPLAMAAARVVLEELMSDAQSRRLTQLSAATADGAEKLLRDAGVPGYAIALGAKGAVVFAEHRVTNYRTGQSASFALARAHAAFQLSRGVLLPLWGKWLFGLAHDKDAPAAYLANLHDFLVALRTAP